MITGCRDIRRNVKIRHLTFTLLLNFDVSTNISASSDRRRMKLPPFDAARRGGSNELRCIFLRSLDAELFNETVKLNQILNQTESNRIELNSESNQIESNSESNRIESNRIMNRI